MSHYAQIDVNNIVQKVIVADEEYILSGAVGDPKNWIQTSYNASFRKNYASIGGTYDRNLDVFIPVKPHNSWLLNTNTYRWEPPVTVPDDGQAYLWDESSISWKLIEEPQLTYPKPGEEPQP